MQLHGGSVRAESREGQGTTFVVALRSGLLVGERAHLYVGAGIVQGSSPHEEFAETQWKLAALASALGVRS